MATYQVGAHTAAPPSEVLAILRTRSRWLSDFLVLAVHRAGVPRATVRSSQPAWFRLGSVDEDGRAGATAQLTWHPHLGDELFHRFEGFVIVLQATDGTIVRLEGHAEGGPPDRNLSALQAIVDLISSALSAATCQAGNR